MRPGSLLLELHVENYSGRLDHCVAVEFNVFKRSQYKQRVLSACVNESPAKPSTQVGPGDTIRMEYLPESSYSLKAQDIALDIIYEDKNVLIVNKARGMVVHPGIGNPDGTLVNAFLYHCQTKGIDLLSINDPFRPGIVHRLDKDTTGVIILAKNSASLEFLAEQFRERKTTKVYCALLEGHVNKPGEVKGFIRRSRRDRTLLVHDKTYGKAAQTFYTPLQRASLAPQKRSKESNSLCAPSSSPTPSPSPSSALTFMEFRPVTGRTHQLRVHAKHIGHPILGDHWYNSRHATIPLMLHAYSLCIILPGHKEPTVFTARPPADMQELCARAHINWDTLL